MQYITERSYSIELLEHAHNQNPGPWYGHSFHVAKATEYIVQELINKGYELDLDIAYNAALLHDIGRYVGFTKSVIHSYDGYVYLDKLGYSGNAITCVLHSFPNGNKYIEDAAEWGLVSPPIKDKLIEVLNEYGEFDLYNKVITLCDALGDENGFTTLEKRLISVGLRHGTTINTSLHWKGYYKIKEEIESMIGKSIYKVLPGIEQSIYT